MGRAGEGGAGAQPTTPQRRTERRLASGSSADAAAAQQTMAAAQQARAATPTVPSSVAQQARLSELHMQMDATHHAAGGGKAGQEALVSLDKELAESQLPQELLLAAMNAQLLETMSALAQRETEVDPMPRELG